MDGLLMESVVKWFTFTSVPWITQCLSYPDTLVCLCLCSLMLTHPSIHPSFTLCWPSVPSTDSLSIIHHPHACCWRLFLYVLAYSVTPRSSPPLCSSFTLFSASSQANKCQYKSFHSQNQSITIVHSLYSLEQNFKKDLQSFVHNQLMWLKAEIHRRLFHWLIASALNLFVSLLCVAQKLAC